MNNQELLMLINTLESLRGELSVVADSIEHLADALKGGDELGRRVLDHEQGFFHKREK